MIQKIFVGVSQNTKASGKGKYYRSQKQIEVVQSFWKEQTLQITKRICEVAKRNSQTKSKFDLDMCFSAEL